MIQIGNVLVSDDVIGKRFVCDLEKCRGACCVEGDSGAPLEKEELAILEKIYPKVEPYLSEDGKKSIQKYGKYLIDDDGDYVTPLVNGELECAYTIFEKGVAKCGIEKAYEEGKIKFKKPISCHLYPIRIAKLKNGDALNYHKWDLCKAACSLGKKLDVPVYKFLETPLIRKYGKKWYKELQLAVKLLHEKE
ncbi:MAG: hypothetical protein BWY67_00798 [Bacteroidetes bacterium ADurb.Bin397]|jgi:hypothetical protein|nr:DUF3109 family protein [Bacteroidia bacterium]OQA11657.1 MAG: hypothetical protein BWY67_00798 [Bacteroidetes bacterium ADurb.Bin397]